MVEHKERPILFSGPMVRAILAGQKTQTRRATKGFNGSHPGILPCPHGATGDRLWVRETFAIENPIDAVERVVCKVDRAAWWKGDPEVYYLAADYSPARWRPSIFMPRWASRLTLEISAVRVERLQDITDADIEAEGVTVAAAVALLGKRAPKGITWPSEPWTLRDAWRIGWSAINGVESWEANPWVWALSFQRVEVRRG